ncbi:DUF885 domain-containing protein [Chryseolinea sp. T2]|uniref:DUF885 domain-containing protein n=1 Tax=Chryseolinea sp. T2 TaxID=3129255 RepID=UPI003076929C
MGIHTYDGQLNDLSKKALDAEVARLKSFDQRMSAFDTAGLSAITKMDFNILYNSIRQELFSFETLRLYHTSPMVYANLDVSGYITRDFAPIEDRMLYVHNMQLAAPALFQWAHENLDDSLARPHIETAIQIAKGGASFMEKELKAAFAGVKNDSLRKVFDESNKVAVKGLRDYASWLEKEKMPKAHNRFAIGRDNYVKMLLYNEGITTSPEEILSNCEKLLKAEQEKFAQVAKKIDPSKGKAIDVFKELQKDHSTAANLIPDARKNAESIRQFLIDKKIISMPSDVRVLIKETPEFARATSTASMDTPGPFEKATQAYYYITPVDVKWSKKQQEEWLSLFSRYVTDVITIHEAYPGHYTQFLHLNASKATRVEKIFTSYAFVEGWAHYTEQMMIEEGFGSSDSLTQAKYHLAQLNESLLRLCRMYVSLKMHLSNMTVEEGTKFIEENAYYEHQGAHHEAMRGTYDPGYLSYTLGKQQFLKLREDYKAKMGDRFSLQEFHDKVLSFGGPPVEMVRERIMN